MDRERMLGLADEFLRAWNTHQVERVLSCYTADLEYRDPNTRGAVRGADAMRRYLTKLFASWRMHWTLRDARLFDGGQGCAVLWHATFRRLARRDDDRASTAWTSSKCATAASRATKCASTGRSSRRSSSSPPSRPLHSPA